MIFTLLIAYQIKHLVADYFLQQNKYMLGKFKPYPDFVLPLLAHSAVHSFLTFLIALSVKPNFALPLALLDGTIHFIVDRIKASPNMLGRYKALSHREYPIVSYATVNPNSTKEQKETAIDMIRDNKYFWVSLGLDQMAHHLTHYLVIWFLV